jgi:hypothetical protein
MESAPLAIRTMTRADVDLAIDWAAAEGWNPGLEDAACFHAADPEGFLLGTVDGEPVATISAVRYGATFGFIGLYIVNPGWRGRGVGMQVWKAALARLAGRTIGLDGVVAQQANYRKSGFALAYRNLRYAGTSAGAGPIDARIVPLSSRPFAEVAAYDRALFPDDRTPFLSAWLGQPHAKAYAVVNGSALAGYGVIRAARTGFKVGPLFADDAGLAEALFGAMQAHVPAGAAVCLDVPEGNVAAVALAERHGLAVSFETARMYAGGAPALPLRRLFGVTTFELG